MCLAIFALGCHSKYKAVIVFQREEFYDRPTDTLGRWSHAPHVLGGRDLLRGGSWFGVSESGRLSALTNIRTPFNEQRKDKLSRGHLVSDYLVDNAVCPKEYLRTVSSRGHDFNAFNLVCGSVKGRGDLYYMSNKPLDEHAISSGELIDDDGKVVRIEAGRVHALCNAHLNTPWPRTVTVRERIAELLEREGDIRADQIFEIMSDRAKPPRESLPDTGVGVEWEEALSPVFIDFEEQKYGSRSCTVVLVDQHDHGQVFERSLHVDTGEWVTSSHSF